MAEPARIPVRLQYYNLQMNSDGVCYEKNVFFLGKQGMGVLQLILALSMAGGAV